MLNRFIFFLLTLILISSCTNHEFNLNSPDKKSIIRISEYDSSGYSYLNFSYQKVLGKEITQIVNTNNFGFSTSKNDFSRDINIKHWKTNKSFWKFFYPEDNEIDAKYEFSSLILEIENIHGAKASVQIKLFDDGMAYRFYIVDNKQDNYEIVDNSIFNLNKYRDNIWRFDNIYEEDTVKNKETFLLSNQIKISDFQPYLVKIKSNWATFGTTKNMIETKKSPGLLYGEWYYVFCDASLNNLLLTNFNDRFYNPIKSSNPLWIKKGMMVNWSHPINSNFDKDSLLLALNLAKEFNFNHIILHQGFDIQINKEISDLIADAENEEINIWKTYDLKYDNGLQLLFSNRDDLREEFNKISHIGIRGIYIFLPDIWYTQYHTAIVDILEDAYDFEIMVVFDSMKWISGLTNKFPQLMSVYTLPNKQDIMHGGLQSRSDVWNMPLFWFKDSVFVSIYKAIINDTILNYSSLKLMEGFPQRQFHYSMTIKDQSIYFGENCKSITKDFLFSIKDDKRNSKFNFYFWPNDSINYQVENKSIIDGTIDFQLRGKGKYYIELFR